MSSEMNGLKREVIQNLMTTIIKSEYSAAAKQSIIEELRVTLPRITSDADEKLKRIEDAGRILLFIDDEAANNRNMIQAFKDLKTSALTCLRGVLTEIELDEKFGQIAPETNKYITSNQQILKEAFSEHNSENHVVKSNAEIISEPINEYLNPQENKKVFIVHGHDSALKNEVARFIERQGIEAIILHEQINQGSTIIEKIESYSNVGFAIILYTPCDLGSSIQKADSMPKPRARQNVVFEHGYFTAKLGRKRVIALNKGSIELPNDISGVVYESYDEAGAWKLSLCRELSAAGYTIDYSKI